MRAGWAKCIAREDVVADLGPLPAALDLADFQGDFPYRGFSLRADGKSFLTSVLTVKGDLWLLQDFDRRIGWLDRLLRRPQQGSVARIPHQTR